MADYDDPKRTIYLTRDAYNAFRTACGDNLFRKLAVANIRYDWKKQSTIKKKRNDLRQFDFMLEVPETHFKRVWDVIIANSNIQAGVLGKPPAWLYKKAAANDAFQTSRNLVQMHTHNPNTKVR